MDTLVRDVPVGLLALLLIGGAIVLSMALTLVLRPRVKAIRADAHNDIVGYVFAVLGVVYGVVLAFLVLAVWNNFASAGQDVAQETAILRTTYADSQTFPDPVRQIFQERLLAYAYSVLDYDWPAMAYGQSSPQSQNALQAIFKEYEEIHPTSNWQEGLYQQAFSRLGDLTTARYERIQASDSSLPTIFWVLLITGGFLTLAFSSLFYLENLLAHLLLNAALAAMIAGTLFLIMEVNFPFAGTVSVSSQPFQQVIQLMISSSVAG